MTKRVPRLCGSRYLTSAEGQSRRPDSSQQYHHELNFDQQDHHKHMQQRLNHIATGRRDMLGVKQAESLVIQEPTMKCEVLQLT